MGDTPHARKRSTLPLECLLLYYTKVQSKGISSQVFPFGLGGGGGNSNNPLNYIGRTSVAMFDGKKRKDENLLKIYDGYDDL